MLNIKTAQQKADFYGYNLESGDRLAFVKADRHVWEIRSGYQTADLVGGRYINHRKYEDLDIALMRDNTLYLVALPFNSFYECDLIHATHRANLYTLHSMHSLSEVCKHSDFTDFAIVTDAKLLQMTNEYNDQYKSKPATISPDHYQDNLEVLPPCRWHSVGQWEVFHVSERYTGDIVRWYAKCGDKCFKFMQDSTITNSEILKLIEGVK